MAKLKSFESFLQKEDIRIPPELTNRIKSIANEYFIYVSQHVCAICDKELTYTDKKLFTDMDFNRVCEKHREYATFFQVYGIRKKLRIKPRTV